MLWQYRGMFLNPRYGWFGLVTWPLFFLFEFLAPIMEFSGWILVPLTAAGGWISWTFALPLLAAALVMGAGSSVVALFLDDRFGYYTVGRDVARLIVFSWAESLGPRQRTVWWRVRALFWNPRRKVWGDMERAGVGNLGIESSPVHTG